MRKIQLTYQDRENRKRKNAAFQNKNRKRKDSPIVLEHYYTSEEFGGHPKGVKSPVVHWNSTLCKARNDREFKLHVYSKRQIQVENFLK